MLVLVVADGLPLVEARKWSKCCTGERSSSAVNAEGFAHGIMCETAARDDVHGSDNRRIDIF